MFENCTGLRTLTTPDWSGSEAWLPEFPLKMKNTVTLEEYAAGTRFPAVASVTYEACEIIIDGDEETTVPKEAFEEIAGTDKDLVIQGDDINGHSTGCRSGQLQDIDVTTHTFLENGESMGFADDDQVLVIDFADNGEGLPGAAEIPGHQRLYFCAESRRH